MTDIVFAFYKAFIQKTICKKSNISELVDSAHKLIFVVFLKNLTMINPLLKTNGEKKVFLKKSAKSMQNHQDAITLDIRFHAPHYKRQVTAGVRLCGHGNAGQTITIHYMLICFVILFDFFNLMCRIIMKDDFKVTAKAFSAFYSPDLWYNLLLGYTSKETH